jgi:hypothetical protein
VIVNIGPAQNGAVCIDRKDLFDPSRLTGSEITLRYVVEYGLIKAPCLKKGTIIDG